MEKKSLLMAAGPTNVPKKYRDILAQEFPHHRTQAFKKLYCQLQRNLKKLLKMDEGSEVVMFTASGTGAMESTVANFFSPSDEVLVVDIGFFGDRYKKICEAYGLKVHHLQYELGQTYQISDVQNILQKRSNIRAIFMTHHETSTGVLNDLQQIGELLKNYPDVLFIVDSISGLVIHPFEMEKWNIDAVVAGSQKGFLIPPGLSFVGLSPKALQRMEKGTLPRFYWDYRMMIAAAKQGQTPSTPAVSLMQALLVATDDLLAKGLEVNFEEHKKRRKYLEQKLTALGLNLGVKNETIKGNVCVPVYLPEGVNALDICRILEEKYNIVTIYGLGKYMQTMLRIGVIGPITNQDIDLMIATLQEILKKKG